MKVTCTIPTRSTYAHSIRCYRIGGRAMNKTTDFHAGLRKGDIRYGRLDAGPVRFGQVVSIGRTRVPVPSLIALPTPRASPNPGDLTR